MSLRIIAVLILVVVAVAEETTTTTTQTTTSTTTTTTPTTTTPTTTTTTTQPTTRRRTTTRRTTTAPSKVSTTTSAPIVITAAPSSVEWEHDTNSNSAVPSDVRIYSHMGVVNVAAKGNLNDTLRTFSYRLNSYEELTEKNKDDGSKDFVPLNTSRTRFVSMENQNFELVEPRHSSQEVLNYYYHNVSGGYGVVKRRTYGTELKKKIAGQTTKLAEIATAVIVFKENYQLVYDDSVVNVWPGSVLIEQKLTLPTFCNKSIPSTELCPEFGHALEIESVIKGFGDKPIKQTKPLPGEDIPTYYIAEKTSLRIGTKAHGGGATVHTMKGYPKLTMRDNKQIITSRFPREPYAFTTEFIIDFNVTGLVDPDPLILTTTMESSTDESKGGESWPIVLGVVLGVLALIGVIVGVVCFLKKKRS